MSQRRIKKRALHLTTLSERFHGLTCPNCGGRADGQTSIRVDGAPVSPKPGDVTICAYCGCFNVFTADLKLRLATPEEKEQFKQYADPAIQKAASIVAKRVQH